MRRGFHNPNMLLEMFPISLSEDPYGYPRYPVASAVGIPPESIIVAVAAVAQGNRRYMEIREEVGKGSFWGFTPQTVRKVVIKGR